MSGHGVPMAQFCSSEAPSSASLGDSCVWGAQISRDFWEYLYPSFILAFIVDIPRTVKQDECPISRTTVRLLPFAVNSILPMAQCQGTRAGGGGRQSPAVSGSHQLLAGDKAL